MVKTPLADQIRPTTIEEVVGQSHLIKPGKPLYQMIQNNTLHSIILWGPPGVGKTTLARIIAEHTGRKFTQLSAVSANKDDMRRVIAMAQQDTASQLTLFDNNETDNQQNVVLFIDEIHRFNKAQQDFLLPYVEDGTIVLIGATTENPSFEVISALLSRSQVFVLEALSVDEIKQIIERGASKLNVSIDENAYEFLANYANGDARQSLNLLDAVHNLYKTETISLEQIKEALQSKHLRYDKHSEEHYNTISAYIKSMRASNVDAALYYLARMVSAGEDPKFIARRMVIFASEDVGMAQPTALVVANEVFRAVETVGYPECQINLAHGTVYLALAAKDRSAYQGYFEALRDAENFGNLEIPLNLRNAPTQLMKDIGYGKGYDMYSTDDLLPEKLKGRSYYKRIKSND